MRRTERDAGFTAFVEARRRHLVRTAYLLCGDSHRAEDLTQQALVRLYPAWPRVGDRGGEDAYVRRALVSAQIDDWRWRSRRASAGTVKSQSARALARLRVLLAPGYIPTSIGERDE